MTSLLVTLIFIGGCAGALLAIFTTLSESRERIAEVMSGRMPSTLPRLRTSRGRAPLTPRVAVLPSRRRAAA